MKTHKAFLLLEINTGMMNGWYFDADYANWALEGFSRRFPDENWVLLSADDRADLPDLPDHMFHRNYRPITQRKAKAI